MHRLCPSCGDERLFVPPICLDGHGVDCPEAACVDCGAAVLIDPLPAAPADVPTQLPTAPGRALPHAA